MASVPFTYETAPAALTDNRGTELNGVIPLTSPAAPHLEKHAMGVKPVGAGVLHVDYRFIVLLVGAVARIDGAPATGLLAPLRGVFTEAWVQAALSKMESLGLFQSNYQSLEAMLVAAMRLGQMKGTPVR